MPTYRIYFHDPAGRLQLGEAFDCANDAEALERLAGFEGAGRTVELWQGGRLVAQRRVEQN